MHLNQILKTYKKSILPKESSSGWSFTVQEEVIFMQGVPRGGEKRQTPLNDQSKWNEHESQVEYRKAHSQQKANLLFPLAEKPVRDFSGRREKNGRERKLFLLVFHLPDSCSQRRELLGIKRQTLLLPFSYVSYSSTL